ncbi:MAG: hypothetical protein IIB58_01240 [Planctomycetes bacterium]|nr:hypothetical protein [Planctomycetota bacterium]
MCLALASCAEFPDSLLDDDFLLDGDPSASLNIDLGENTTVAPSQLIETVAHVLNEDQGELFYLWEYALLESANTIAGSDAIEVAQPDDYVKDWTGISFVPQDLFPGTDIRGKVLRVRVNVIEMGESTREGVADRFLSITTGNPNGDEGNTGDTISELVPGDDLVVIDEGLFEDAVDSNDNENENENGDYSENGDNSADGNLTPPPSGGNNSNDNNNDSNDNGTPDPCDGITALTVTLTSALSMSLFEGSINLDPTVCGGTAPYTYDWTPVTDLVDANGGLGGGAAGTVTSEDVDFRASTAGDFTITVDVTDDDGTVESVSTTITVNDYNPLIAQAGADAGVDQNSALDLTGTVLGGSGSFTYSWTPSGPTTATFSSVPTGTVGDTTYTFTVTDAISGAVASDTVKVVVFAVAGSCTNDYDLGVSSADFVAFDSGHGSAGQAVVVSGSSVILFDLNTLTVRATLSLPSSGQGLAVDTARGRAYVTTRLSGLFTRSVQVIDLDNATLGANIGLTTNVALASGMAIVPSTGDVLVAVSGGSGTDGLMVISGGTSLGNAVQNMHHTDSFQQPVDVAVLEQGGLSVAVVANMTGSFVTLVALSGITYTPDDSSGGGQASLAQVVLNGTPRGVIAQPASSRAIIAWNDGDQGRVQVITLADNQNGSAGADIPISGAVLVQALAIRASSSEVYAAIGVDGVSVVDLTYSVEASVLTGAAGSAFSVASEENVADRVLIVGNGSKLSERCP